MKIKYTYILILAIILFVGCNKTYADEELCYYKTDKFQARLIVRTGYDYPRLHTFEQYTDVTIERIGTSAETDAEDINNWFGYGRKHETAGGYEFKNLYSGSPDANKRGKCPTYLVFQYCTAYRVWGTNDETEARTATAAINSDEDCVGYYASHLDKTTGAEITEEEYWETFKNPSIGGQTFGVDCTIFGDKNNAGRYETDGTMIEPPSIRYLVDQVLGYVRIIVPVLIILLGAVDFARAATAGKEDEMKKAQTTFVKRLIAGIFVFLVPILIDAIMWLTDKIWTYGNLCKL